jgi:hypothetical protein
MDKRLHTKQTNFYLRVLAVQEIYSELHPAHSNKWIYENKIKPRFITISRSTFYEYLNINAKGELTRLRNEQSSSELQCEKSS